MARLVTVTDEPLQSDTNLVLILVLAIVGVALVALAFFWSSGYMGGPRIITMMPAATTQMMVPGTQGTAGPAGAAGGGGAGGAAGAAGAAGAPGAAGAAGADGTAGSVDATTAP